MSDENVCFWGMPPTMIFYEPLTTQHIVQLCDKVATLIGGGVVVKPLSRVEVGLELHLPGIEKTAYKNVRFYYKKTARSSETWSSAFMQGGIEDWRRTGYNLTLMPLESYHKKLVLAMVLSFRTNGIVPRWTRSEVNAVKAAMRATLKCMPDT